MGFLYAVNGSEFYRRCYHPMGDFMDVMALINSAVNFILYCLMSKQFRKTFADLMGISPKLLKSEHEHLSRILILTSIQISLCVCHIKLY